MSTLDDLYMKWQDLVDCGELDPVDNPMDQWVEDQIGLLTDRAMDRMDMER